MQTVVQRSCQPWIACWKKLAERTWCGAGLMMTARYGLARPWSAFLLYFLGAIVKGKKIVTA